MGDKRASAATRPYARPTDPHRPIATTMVNARRSPRPVFRKPCAMNIAAAINHGTSAEKAAKAADHERIFEATPTASAIIATAPVGKGCRTIPVIVERNNARSCQACGVNASGLGTIRTKSPAARVRSRGNGLAGDNVVKGSGTTPSDPWGGFCPASEDTGPTFAGELCLLSSEADLHRVSCALCSDGIARCHRNGGDDETCAPGIEACADKLTLREG
mmetsp:Transcript_28773/g.81030  ORF Transcript_28773/g.81030 Transcript_28773/m.81030 type:complete len:218 (-) Transcript_28773:283-936(-)